MAEARAHGDWARGFYSSIWQEPFFPGPGAAFGLPVVYFFRTIPTRSSCVPLSLPEASSSVPSIHPLSFQQPLVTWAQSSPRLTQHPRPPDRFLVNRSTSPSALRPLPFRPAPYHVRTVQLAPARPYGYFLLLPATSSGRPASSSWSQRDGYICQIGCGISPLTFLAFVAQP
jgi:hypothetical protein